MRRWIAGRTAQAAVTIAVAAVLMFVLMRVTPGDPLARLMGDRPMSAEEVAALQALYGLDQPIPQQFTRFVSGLARGELGVSIEYRIPVTTLIRQRLPASLLLGGTVLVLNFTLGIWLGALQAVRLGGRLDRWLSTLSLAAFAMPSFWLGLILAWLVGIRWHLLPALGMIDPLLPPDAGVVVRSLDILRHLVLPALTLSIVSIAATMRYQRTAMIEALREPYIRTARAKGLSERRVIWRHAWRTALFPVITLFGLWLPIVVTGSVFVEHVFNWPGLGSLTAKAISGRDYPVIMGASLLAAALVVGGGWLTDMAYAWLDPRVRHAA
ncbi:MAG: ABC transporter permease [Gemmatimonadales bacterium]|nr:MAG: ABC transporter permease [Gemmatimonadales bacterium]